MDTKTIEKVYKKIEGVVEKLESKDPKNKCIPGLGLACQYIYDMYIESVYDTKK